MCCSADTRIEIRLMSGWHIRWDDTSCRNEKDTHLCGSVRNETVVHPHVIGKQENSSVRQRMT